MKIDNLWEKGINSTDLIGKEVTISGWGETETGKASNILMKQTLTIGGVVKDALLNLSYPMGYGSDSGDSGGTCS